MPKQRKFINGTCQQLLFSPKGGIEGVLIREKGQLLQVSFSPEVGAVLARTSGEGKRLRVLAVPDHSPKTADAAHPVYQFDSFADAAGQAIELEEEDEGSAKVKGVVAAIHFARHGQPNGVILESGEFIHLRPPGMEKAGLKVGARVDAVGELRMTLLGTRLLEARRVNRIELE